jgi:enediyne biosynthesis protein E4
MFRLSLRSIGTLVPIVVLLSCGPRPAPLFKLLSPDQTGITFANTITTTDSLNALTDPYVYNGAGVGVGDLDNDGLADIFFAGNLVSSRLYLNKGNMRFEDITQPAGVTTHRWATGVTMVDINQDGWLDIYVSVSGPEWSSRADRANLLFLNKGDRTFTEAAARYGVADSGFTTHSAFVDYDGDGDLDLFLLNNSPKDFARRGIVLRPDAGRHGKAPDSYNRLYRNNGDGSFTNVSDQAGILREVGYGLGVAVADLSGDGRPDIYVSNDITPNDVLYVNNGDGTFTDKAAQWLKHTSFAGMGVDIADFNNDGRPDILQADMMPPALPARKRMSGHVSYGDVLDLHRRGFRVDYEINSLQLHAGFTSGGDVVFSEIARMAGVAYTDWSWAVLFADFDNDGWKDIFVTNGYPKALNDLDYTVDVFRAQRAGNTQRARDLLRNLRSYDVPNYLFRNDADLTFTDRSAAWGMRQPGFAYGAAYVDLNDDGKLDLVVNNMDAPASIYENVQPPDDHHYLRIELRGEAPNLRGIGSTLAVVAGGRKQYLYQSPYRGYMSTVDDRLHFGLGAATHVDTLAVTWPDGRSQVLTNLPIDRMLTLKQDEATRQTRYPITDTRAPRFQPLRTLHYRDPEASAVDFAVQPLLPDHPSREGPPLAVGDVNGDGLEDLFIGGGDGVPGKLFLQRKDGGFVESVRDQPWAADRDYADWGARFFDANGDGRLDLYVASGGYQVSPISSLLQDRLYTNRGGGRFVRDSAALPPMPTSTAAIAVGDFTGDGRPDLFVGGRLVPRNYPLPARSYLLRNDRGRFTDVTDSVAPELAQPTGMITAAVWVDFDGDGRLDLVTAGLWMPLRFFKNDGRRLHDVTASMKLPPLRGWWYSLAAGDFNHDGRVDLVAGNLGLNHTYTASAGAPLGVYAADFTGHQTTDVVLTERQQGREYPTAGASALVAAIYTLGVKFPTTGALASATVDQLFTPGQLRAALHYEADTFASIYLQNDGGGTFTPVPLPNLAQISPIRGIVAHDVDGDGNLDLIVAGNLNGTEPNTPPADAGNGLWLKGDGRGHFTPVPPVESGFLAPRYVTGLALVKTPAGQAVLVANHGDSLQAFTITEP